MQNHTLKAVLSMPNELFFNSKVGTNTCVIVTQAHIPHSFKKDVFLGYFKDDGFTKRKLSGRYDYDNLWSKIRSVWLDAYFNNKNIPGLCVTKKLEATDEWCAEAYMQTNYNDLNKTYFEKTIKDYCVYKLNFDFCKDISSKSINENDIDLRTEN